jgi:hypothetical protein
MIQRIQTLYLLAVVVLHIFVYILPEWHAGFPKGPARVEVSVHNTYTEEDEINAQTHKATTLLRKENIRSFIVNNLIDFGSLFIIFMFKKRRQQLNFARLLMGMDLALIGFSEYYIYEAKKLITAASYESGFGVAFFIPFVSLILLYLASRAIDADEKLVRSADRLR